MMIREDSHIALDTVVILAMKNGDHYENEADLVSDDLTPLFHELAARHRTMAKRLGMALRSDDDLPSEPDRDKEVLEDIITRIKTFMASDEEAELLRERKKGEEELAAAVDEALKYQWPDETTALLERFQRDIGATRSRLQKLRQRR